MDSVSVYTEMESGKANMIIYFLNLFMSHPKDSGGGGGEEHLIYCPPPPLKKGR